MLRQNIGKNTKTDRECTVRKLLTVIALASLCAACQHKIDDGMDFYGSGNLEERHPILVKNGGADLDVAVQRDAKGLAGKQRRDVSRFLASYKTRGDTQIDIMAPIGSANEQATFIVLKDIKALANAYNIPVDRIAFRTYNAEAHKAGLIHLSYGRYTVQAPECGHWPANLGEDPLNRHYRNYGCAQQKNLAAMISNPRDLVRPRAETARSSERRDVMWEKYVKGESTVSEKKAEEKGAVSDVAKN